MPSAVQVPAKPVPVQSVTPVQSSVAAPPSVYPDPGELIARDKIPSFTTRKTLTTSSSMKRYRSLLILPTVADATADFGGGGAVNVQVVFEGVFDTLAEVPGLLCCGGQGRAKQAGQGK